MNQKVNIENSGKGTFYVWTILESLVNHRCYDIYDLRAIHFHKRSNYDGGFADCFLPDVGRGAAVSALWR